MITAKQLLMTLAICFQPYAIAEKFKDGQKNFEAALELIQNHHLQGNQPENNFYQAATKGLIEGTDPKNQWDSLLSPKEYAELIQGLKQELVGAGVELSFDKDSGHAQVLHVFPGTAAEASNLYRGDIILRVDNQDFKGKEFKEMILAIRGKIGTKVKLDILREGSIIKKSLTRAPMQWDVVEGRLIGKNMGLVVIKAFLKNTPKELREHLTALSKKGAKKWIFDLRENTGGSLNSGIKSASLLLEKDSLIATSIKRDGARNALLSNGDTLIASDHRIVLLVDEQTRSFTEILTVALKVHREATVIGQTTSGKWNAQTVEKLPNGWALKMTNMKLEGADGKEYHGIGVKPDVVVKEASSHPAKIAKAMRSKNIQDWLEIDPVLKAGLSVLNL